MNNTRPSLTLAITTYERPDALAAVLSTVRRQSRAPDEVVVADDGSGAATGVVIEWFASHASVPVHHVRQEHEGFRAGRARNLAIAKASSDYIVFVDGDMLLHPEFVRDHRRHAREGAYTQGVRIPLDPQRTAHVLAKPDELSRVFDNPGGGRRRLYGIHSPQLANLTRRLGNHFIALKACNLGVWRTDLIHVNGFNEDMVGWGSEDKELCARLENSGVTRQTLLFGGIALHLHHPPASRDRLAENELILSETRASQRAWSDHGLDAHIKSRTT